MTQLLGWILAAGASVLAALLAIPKGLWSRWHTRLVDRIDHSLRRRATRFGHRYREHLLASLRFIDLKGLATIGFYTPELDEVFVDVSLAYRSPHLVQDGVLSQVPPEVIDRQSLDEFLSRPRPVTLAVLGGPGSGKTTLLRHTAQEICRRRKNSKVPVLLYLRDHVTTVVESPGATLPDLVRITLGRYHADEPPGWFEQRLREGNCVILLDGLDEVAMEADRRRLSAWVERQTKQYPLNDFVITSRPQGYRSAPIDGALVLQVRSFTEEQISRFVHGWYLAMERHSTGLPSDEIRVRAESASNDLLARLKDTPALDDLTVNPLLLTMIANVHRYRGALPGSRSDLYGEICQVMLWRRAEAKDMPLQLNGDKKESLLRGLAFTMMQQRVRDLPRADILRELSNALRRVSTSLTEEDFLADATSNGLLLERESGVYSFAHLTFQEYLASAYIRDKGGVQILVDMVDDIWWRETTLLYAAKSDADPVVKACLRSASVTALILAFDCVDQGSELAPDLRDRLERILNTRTADPDLARARTGLLVARHLRPQARTATGGRVCTRPITNFIYDLFVAENPAHWVWQASATPGQPVRGVHGSAASTFVRWANAVTDGDPGYRLPDAAEIGDTLEVSPYAEGVSVWVSPRNRQQTPELWTSSRLDNPHSISRSVLVRYVAADLSAIQDTIDKLRLVRAKVIVVALQVAFKQTTDSFPTRLTVLRVRINNILNTETSMDDVLGLRTLFSNQHRLDNTIQKNMGRVLALCLRRAVEHDRSRVPARVQEDETDLERVDIADLERVFDTARDIARDRASELDTLIDSACAQLVGRAPSRLFMGNGPSTLPERLADVLLAKAGMPATQAHIHTSLDVLRTLRPQAAAYPASRWESAVTHELYKSMDRLNEAKSLPTGTTASRIRLPALCLAGEATSDMPHPRREWLLQLIASVTLLEQRATGLAPRTETIMLATA